jgi:prolyl-tRNA editing enzyme YbaK/EbsC (Cys-tRNA(Pro) deacylase)
VSVARWPQEVERVASYMRAAGAEARLEELRGDGASARDAADAIGCTLGQIVKSILLVCDGTPVMALVPGDRRVDTKAVARTVGARHARIGRAEEVVSATGFEPGAVAPFPLQDVARVLIDRTLLPHPVVWCGAGSSRHLVAVTPPELQRLAQADIADVAGPREPDAGPDGGYS